MSAASIFLLLLLRNTEWWILRCNAASKQAYKDGVATCRIPSFVDVLHDLTSNGPHGLFAPNILGLAKDVEPSIKVGTFDRNPPRKLSSEASSSGIDRNSRSRKNLSSVYWTSQSRPSHGFMQMSFSNQT
ncbi:hypothetical protein E4U55_005793 [Claviceps digitariae]|nr:hypothetical protein E4U55_005793 [Claviceps digitariae]